ncbi:MAG: hypothetical protein IV092_05885 [Burkholderiaceae bacterium]|nr:hypothetical protein [Burkholderiaceae bacterium]
MPETRRLVNTQTFTLWACVVLSSLVLPAGGFALGLHVLLLLGVAGFLLASGAQTRSLGPWEWTFALTLAAHSIYMLGFSFCADLQAKSLLSLALFAAVLLALRLLAQQAGAPELAKPLRVILLVSVASVVIDRVFLTVTGASAAIRPSGIFKEPSHLALAVTPLLLAMLFSPRRRDAIWALVGFAVLTTLSASSTLIVMFLPLAVVVFLLRYWRELKWMTVLKAGLIAGLLGTALAASPYLDEFGARLEGLITQDESSNLSSLVYLYGWDAALINFERTSGWGLGFNRMGCSPIPDSDFASIIDLIGDLNANYNDGSFTFAKVMSEAGWLSVVLWLGLALALIKRAWTLAHCDRLFFQREVLAFAAIFVLVVGGLVRGSNYFAGPVLLGVYALFLAHSPRPGARPRAQSSSGLVPDAAADKIGVA